MKYILLFVVIILLLVFLYSSGKREAEYFVDYLDNPEQFLTSVQGDDSQSYIDLSITSPYISSNDTDKFPNDHSTMVPVLWTICNNLYSTSQSIDKSCDDMNSKLDDLKKLENFVSPTNVLDNPEITFKCVKDGSCKIIPTNNNFNTSEIFKCYPALENMNTNTLFAKPFNNLEMVPLLWKATSNLHKKILKNQDKMKKLQNRFDALK